MAGSHASDPRRLGALAALCVLAGVLAALLHLPAESSAQGKRAQTKKPNFLVIMTDDQTVADLGAMSRTKTLLAGKGVNFRNSFVSYPVCCPSRATFFSGQYAHNHKVMGLYPPTGGYGKFDMDNSLGTWLQRSGYYTGHIGKMLNGYGSDTPANIPRGFNEWYASVDPSTYRMYGYTLNENGTFVTYGDEDTEDPATYQTDVLTNKATDYIRRNASRPFFLSLAYVAPHHEQFQIRQKTGVSVRPAPRHKGVFSSAQLPIPPNFGEADLTDKPAYVQRRSPLMTQTDVDQIAANYRTRQESLLAVDEGVESLMKTLSQTGTLRNTYVIFTSDNGFLQGEHRVRSGKLLAYEPSIRVPLLIRGPGLARGRESGELVTNADLAPTILEAAKARPGKVVDGRSLLPYADNPRLRSKRVLLLETGGVRVGQIEQDPGPVRPLPNVLTYSGVRTLRYKYIAYRNGSKEMYDLRRDPYEMRSVHDDPRYREARLALNRELMRLKTCRGDVCRQDARPIPGRGPRIETFLGLGPTPVPAPQPEPVPARGRRR
jgi:arylsulfatase A-like enzyme